MWLVDEACSGSLLYSYVAEVLQCVRHMTTYATDANACWYGSTITSKACTCSAALQSLCASFTDQKTEKLTYA